jgi:penicillin-binding protein 1A
LAVDTAPKRAKRGRKHARGKARTKQRGFFRRYWWAFAAAPFVAFLAVFAALFVVYARLELPATPPPLQTTYLYDADGNVIATLHSTVDRTIIAFADMPNSLRNAVIATEDKGFYSHGGIDPIGILRAAWNDLVSHQVVQGGSTITQQLVKNVYAGHYVTDPGTKVTTYVVPPRTFGQKIREALLAVKLEQTYSKDEILAKYLNTIYFGHGAYGVQAAAQTYWSKDAKDLTPLESATLAGAITNPSAFDPIANPADSQVRRNYVLDRMAAAGVLDAARAAQLKAKPVRTTPSDVQAQFPP